MIIDFTWRDGISLISLLVGALSYRWGIRQAALAQDAKQAEDMVRKELYKSEVTQRISKLSVSIMKVHSTVLANELVYATEAAWELISDFSHVIGFCKRALSQEESLKLESARDDCSKIASILSVPSDEELENDDKKMVSRVCLDTLMYVRHLQGRLENIDSEFEETRALKAKTP